MDSAWGDTAVTTPATPGEASAAVNLRVTAFDKASGAVSISYTPACGSTDHTVYSGPLAGVPGMSFDQRDCGRGVSGATSFTLGPGSRFFLIVGKNSAKEGSYGRNRAGIERPEDTGASACNVPQDLSAACVP
jgi:hypothetical protein